MESSDASPALAARRELSEETGYDTETIIELGQVAPNPALQNNRCHSFLALGVRPLGVQELDDAEDIRVEEFELLPVTGDCRILSIRPIQVAKSWF